MAVYTDLDHATAQAVLQAHGAGELLGLEGLAAGSVNSNFLLKSTNGSYFCRVYEEQGVDGVRYEWALLDALQAQGLAVPQRIRGPEAGTLQVGSKPVALFAVIGGDELCQARVRAVHLEQLGEFLGKLHAFGKTHRPRRASRFDAEALGERIALLRSAVVAGEFGASGAAIAASLGEIEAALQQLKANEPLLRQSVIHGDLFRDNVRWRGDALLAVLDWESASEGPQLFDVAVGVHAWCYGNGFDWDLASSVCQSYQAVAALPHREWLAFAWVLRSAALRFCVTRLTDFELRRARQPGMAMEYRDFSRFVDRLHAVAAWEPQALVARLLPELQP